MPRRKRENSSNIVNGLSFVVSTANIVWKPFRKQGNGNGFSGVTGTRDAAGFRFLSANAFTRTIRDLLAGEKLETSLQNAVMNLTKTDCTYV